MWAVITVDRSLVAFCVRSQTIGRSKVVQLKIACGRWLVDESRYQLLSDDYNPLSGLLSVLGESLAELHHGSRSAVASHLEGALLLLCLMAAAFR
jgi:hypothetical protein